MPQSEQLLALYRQLLIIRNTEEQLAPFAPDGSDSRRLPYLCRGRGDCRRRVRALAPPMMPFSARTAGTGMPWQRELARTK